MKKTSRNRVDFYAVLCNICFRLRPQYNNLSFRCVAFPRMSGH